MKYLLILESGGFGGITLPKVHHPPGHIDISPSSVVVPFPALVPYILRAKPVSQRARWLKQEGGHL